jgi:hypothetical protein
MRKLVLYARQARAEAHMHLYIKVWIQRGGWVDEGTYHNDIQATYSGMV